MYTLGIPNRQKRRTLGYLKQKWIEFKEYPSMEGFFEVRFPGLDEEGFRDISNKLKSQGVTLIGADSQLTEKKIMKLTDLMNEQALGYNAENYPLGSDEESSQGFNSDDLRDILTDLKNILQIWGTKTYDNAEDRYMQYFLDIEDLVNDYEMGNEDYEEGKDNETEPNRIDQQKLRKKIRNEIKRIFQ